MRKPLHFKGITAVIPLLFLILAAALVLSLALNSTYPAGEDTLLFLYRGDVVYRNIRQGILFPFYDPMWFNGTELLRYSSPLCAYLLALCQAVAGGSMYSGYLIFVGVLFYAGAVSWFLIGWKCGRPLLGAVLGAAWFLWPCCCGILFVQGDLPRALAGGGIVPALLYCVLSFHLEGNWRRLPFIGLFSFLLVLAHAGTAGMTLFLIVFLALLSGLVWRLGRGRIGSLISAVLAGMMAAGLWLLPFLTGGPMSLDRSEEMLKSFQALQASLNPRVFYSSGTVYFGLSLLVLLFLCALFSPGETSGPAWCAILLLLLTAEKAGSILQVVPGGVLLRMTWLFPLLCAVGFLCLLRWSSLRRPLALLLCLLILAEAAPSLPAILNTGEESVMAEDRMEARLSALRLDQAQKMTKNRLAILEDGALGGRGIALATCEGDPVPVSTGDDRTWSSLNGQLLRIYRALGTQGYLYVFDRCLEMGCDTVLLQVGMIPAQDLADGLVEQAAAVLGYSLAYDGGAIRVYHTQLGSGWGLVSEYSAIQIGETPFYSTAIMAAMEESADPNLDNYTFEELSRYDLIFLSGFTYTDKERAEALILSLSEAGVRIILEADGIPENATSRNKGFLGVLCNAIEFSNGFPELNTIDGILNPSLFPQGYTNWSTYYVEGLDDVWGFVTDEGLDLPFLGTVHNENIVVIGLNLSLYQSLTQDKTIKALLSHTMDKTDNILPRRKIVPLGVQYGAGRITVTAYEDNTNTTLAWHDFFVSDRPLYNNGGFLTVDKGTTVIDLRYPYFYEGLAVSLLGVLALAAITLRARKNAIYNRELQEPARVEETGQQQDEPAEGAS